MAQDIVSGLFGLSPNEVAQQQWMNTNQAADRFAQMDPFQRSAQMMFKGGSGLAQAGAGMLGIQNPAIAEAEARQAALSGLDMSSPESIMQRAQQVTDPRLKMQLQMLAQQKMAEAQKAKLEQLKLQNEMSPWAKRDQSKFTPESVKEAMRTGEMWRLEPIEKQMTPSEYAKMLMEGGLDPKSPEFQRKMMAYVEAKRTGTEKGAGSTLVMPGDKTLVDIPKFRKDVQDTVKPHAETVNAADKVLSLMDEAITGDNPNAFNAARTQLAKAAGDSQISLKEIEAAGGDPSIAGKITNKASELFTGTPTLATMKDMVKAAEILRKVAASRARSEIARQRKLGELSKYTPQQLDAALDFPEFADVPPRNYDKSGAKPKTSAQDRSLIEKYLTPKAK